MYFSAHRSRAVENARERKNVAPFNLIDAPKHPRETPDWADSRQDDAISGRGETNATASSRRGREVGARAALGRTLRHNGVA